MCIRDSPVALRHGAAAAKLVEGKATESIADQEQIKKLFQATYGSPQLTFDAGGSGEGKAVNVGVILSGGQAPGGHNVIAGIFDGVKSINPASRVFGFLKGPDGLVKNEYMELTFEIIDAYRNTGGFDMIGSGRTKLETEEQFETGRANCEKLGINAPGVIGGDDSNTNACLLAENYKKNKIPIKGVGFPKTITGDRKNEQIEVKKKKKKKKKKIEGDTFSKKKKKQPTKKKNNIQ
eukprot:TRINITY_DN29674_c0_g1_i1.p2 TRINITY_DN29674_c0_g1~~TRINITY_DN29674_c0_g1_i1.p2  ORF type:complete len:262 (+),score=67.16 TRINITY_DN29674_c0_g1_i1:81-788(+)